MVFAKNELCCMTSSGPANHRARASDWFEFGNLKARKEDQSVSVLCDRSSSSRAAKAQSISRHETLLQLGTRNNTVYPLRIRNSNACASENVFWSIGAADLHEKQAVVDGSALGSVFETG